MNRDSFKTFAIGENDSAVTNSSNIYLDFKSKKYNSYSIIYDSLKSCIGTLTTKRLEKVIIKFNLETSNIQEIPVEISLSTTKHTYTLANARLTSLPGKVDQQLEIPLPFLDSSEVILNLIISCNTDKKETLENSTFLINCIYFL